MKTFILPYLRRRPAAGTVKARCAPVSRPLSSRLARDIPSPSNHVRANCLKHFQADCPTSEGLTPASFRWMIFRQPAAVQSAHGPCSNLPVGLWRCPPCQSHVRLNAPGWSHPNRVIHVTSRTRQIHTLRDKLPNHGASARRAAQPSPRTPAW